MVATDTALSILETHGIRADFVVSVDPQDKNTLYLLYARKKEPYLVIDSAASFMSLLRYPQDRIILYDTIFPLYEELSGFWGSKGKLLCGGSVSTTAFDLARFLKCDPIVFVGQDLAFSSKHTHIKGSALEDFLYSRINRFQTYEAYNTRTLLHADRIEVAGNMEDKVSTDRKFVTFMDWFTREFKGTKARIINATEGGARLALTETATLAGTVTENNLLPIPDKTIRIDQEQHSQEPYLNLLESILSEIERLIPAAVRARISAGNARNAFKRHLEPGIHYQEMGQFDAELMRAIRAERAGSYA